MPLSLLNHSALALFAQRTRIPTSARSIGFCAIWVCISSSSSSLPFEKTDTLQFRLDYTPQYQSQLQRKRNNNEPHKFKPRFDESERTSLDWAEFPFA